MRREQLTEEKVTYARGGLIKGKALALGAGGGVMLAAGTAMVSTGGAQLGV